MNKKQFFIKLLAIVVGGVAVFLLSSCFTSLRILSCKKSCMESCNSCSSNKDDISGHEYGIYYTLNNSGDYYMVSEVGYKETDVIIPETYEGYPVMGLKYRAFEHYKSNGVCSGGYYFGMHLSSLTLPKTIRFIEHGVFASGSDYNYHAEPATCDKLIFEGTIQDWCEINFDSYPLYGGAKLYIDGELLTDLVIPESVTKIKDNAFAFYSWFDSVTLHENITEIGSNAFWSSNIQTITFPCTDLTIWQGAFFRCKQLEDITFTGETLDLANGSIFAECPALKEVEWNTVNLTHIPEYTFAGCVGLESFVIPASVESIGDNAFDGCINIDEVFNLSKLEVNEGSETHGKVAYYAGVVHTADGENGYILTEGDYKFVVSDGGITLFKYVGEGGALILPDNGTSYDIRDNTFMINYDIVSVDIPKCVTAIGANAFYDCANLKVVSGCEGIKTLGNGAFNGCVSLERISLANVEEIGDYAFTNCAFTSLALPETLTKIGKEAFASCEKLTSLTLPKSLTSIGSRAFDGCTAELTYDGTLEQWAEITLGAGFTQVTVICSDGEWVGII